MYCLYQSKSSWSWTGASRIVSQDKPFLFISWWSQVPSNGNRKLTNLSPCLSPGERCPRRRILSCRFWWDRGSQDISFSMGEWLFLWISAWPSVSLRLSLALCKSRSYPGLPLALGSKDLWSLGEWGFCRLSASPLPFPPPAPLNLIPQSLTDIKNWQGILPPAVAF